MNKKRMLAFFLAFTMVMPTIGVSAEELEPTTIPTEISVAEPEADEPIIEDLVVEEPAEEEVVIDEPEAEESTQNNMVLMEEEEDINLFADYPDDGLSDIASGTCGDNLTWELDGEGILTISGTGDMDDFTHSSAPWKNHRGSISTIILKDGLTSIGAYAFYSCSSPTEITIPEGVTSIGRYVFSGCSSLTEITIPEGVTSIGSSAFSDCNSLIEITIPEGVTSIGYSAFNGCNSLTEITIPEGVTSIGDSAFYSCDRLTAITIPESVTSIGDSAFDGCYSLTAIDVALGNVNYKSIEGILFSIDGKNLIKYPAGKTAAVYNIPVGVTSIGDYAFEWCSSLTEITIPEGVTSIGDFAFECCSSLTEITIPEGVTSIGDWAFYDCESLTEITIPEGVTSIGDSAFSNCESLTEITIPEGVTSIGRYVFSGCSSLTEITIPEGVTSIGAWAFSGCSSLTEITIPASVTSIGDFSFYCESLTDVYYGGTEAEWNAISIGTSFNDGLKNATIHFTASNPSGTCGDNLTWELDAEGTLTISGTGDMTNFEWSDNQPWSYQNTGVYVKSIEIKEGVTSIGTAAFSYHQYLTELVIPEGVTRINSYALEGLENLAVLRLPSTVTYIGNIFAWNSLRPALKTLTYNGCIHQWEKVTFGNYALVFTPTCVEYSEVTIPGKPATNTETGLTDGIICSYCGEVLKEQEIIEVESPTGACGDNLTWELDLATGTLTISGTGDMDDFGSASPWAVYGQNILSVVIEEGVTSVGNEAFNGCDKLNEITIPEGVTSIGDYAFECCGSLTAITLPDSLLSIGSDAFFDCVSLTAITIPASVTNIGSGAFESCRSLTAIDVALGNMNYKSIEGILFSIDGENLIQYPAAKTGTAYNIPDGVTSIGDRAFESCVSLEEIIIPASVASIGHSAFESCINLEAITIPEGVTGIGYSTFSYCRSLEEIIIPEGVTSIGVLAFYYCGGLTEITIPASVTEIGAMAFDSCSNLTDVYYGGTEEEWEEISIGTDNEYLTNATIHFTEAEESATLYLEYVPVSIAAGGEASFYQFTIMSTDGFTPGEKLLLTLNDGFAFDEDQTMIDGDTKIKYKWVDDTEMYIYVPEDSGDGFDLEGLTILAGEDLNAGETAEMTVSGNNYISGTSIVATVTEGADAENDSLELEVEEYRQILPGGTAVYDSMLLTRDVPFSEEVITLTLDEGFTFVEGMTITDVGNPITILELEGNTLVIQAPFDSDGEIGLDGLTIAAAEDAAIDKKIILYASMDGYEETKATIGRVVEEIVDEIWLDFEELDFVAGETSSFEDFCIMKYFEFTPGQEVTLTLSEGFSFPADQTLMDGDTEINYQLNSEREMVVYAPEGPGNGFDLTGLTIFAEVGVEKGDEVVLTVTVEGCEEIEEEIGEVQTEADDVLYLDVDPVEIKAGGKASFTVLGVDKGRMFTEGDEVTLTLNEGFSFLENDTYYDHNRTPIERISWSERKIVVLAPEDPGFGFDLEDLTIVADADVPVGEKARLTASMDGYDPVTKTAAKVVEGSAIISGTCGPNLTWTYDPDPDTLTITGIGEMYDFIYNGGGHDVPVSVANELIAFEATSEAPWAAYRTDIATVVIEENVTSIGDYAFAGCSNLEQVTIPRSLTSIGDGAFYGCDNLTDVYYDGTEAEWNAISKGVNNEILNSADIHLQEMETDIIASGECGDDLTWEFDPATGTLTIYGFGEMYDYYDNIFPLPYAEGELMPLAGSGEAPWAAYRTDITTVVIEEGATSIGDKAFRFCGNLEEAVIPSSVTNIGYLAFADTNRLSEIKIPEGVVTIEMSAFEGSSSLKQITLPRSLTNIGSRAFYWCQNLKDVYYNGSEKEWNAISMVDNDELTNVTIHFAITNPSGECGDNLTWELDLETGTLTIEGTGDMADYEYGDAPWFDYAEEITSVVIKEGATSIGDNAFNGCEAMEEITIPSGVTAIGDNAFTDCPLTDVHYDGIEAEWDAISKGENVETDLKDATIHVDAPEIIESGKCGDNLTWTLDENGLLSIVGTGAMYDYGNYSIWYGNSKITSVHIGEGVTTIGSYAFNACTNLEEIILPETLISIGECAFNVCSKLTEIDMPDSLTSIGKEAFLYCTGLTSVDWSENLTTIGEGAFKFCYGLTSVTLPDSVTSIGEEAFYECKNLTSVVLPEGLTVINSETFSACKKLESITIPASVKTIADSAFYNCPALTDVYYGSTEFIWNKISIGRSNESLTKAEIHFTDLCGEGHTEVTDEAKAPTCTETGLTAGSHCEICGVTIVAQEVIPFKGHEEVTIEGKAPTCTETGLTEGKRCSVCGVTTVEQEEIPFKGHDEVIIEGKEATCTEEGKTEGKYCSVCKTMIAEPEVIPSKGHKEVTDEAKAPTCTEDGLTAGSHCSVCGEVFEAQEEIPFKGHTEVTDEAKAPTCTEDGLTEGKHCTVCGVTTEAQEVIPSKGHDEEVIEGKEATCTEEGKTEGRYCAVCMTMLAKPEVIPSKGHTEVTDEAKAPTCTEDGLTAGSHCSVCGEVFEAQEEIPSKGHTEETIEGKAPTCTEEGLTEGKYCTVCGVTTATQEVIPFKGHTEATIEGKAPTCTEDGLTEGKHCTVCGVTTKAQEVIPSKGHTEATIEGKVPTCTEEGLTEGKHCTVCGVTTKTQEEIPSKGHTEATIEGKAPTCTEDGLTEGKHCTVCGVTTKAQEVIPSKGHTEETIEGKAPTCTEDGLTEGKHCTVCGVTTAAQTVIPSKGHTEAILPYVAPTKTSTGLTEGKYCSVCGTTLVAQTVIPMLTGTEEVARVYGTSRCDTAMKAADTLKEVMNVSKFNTVIVANAQNFADALGGSYLAAAKNAPILMTNIQSEAKVKDYIRNNLKQGGTIYILGGPLAVASSFETGLDDFRVNRLYGTSRYDTNLEILKEAGVTKKSEVLVCTGTNFADSLSASATGKPILMVGNSLTANQKTFLNGLSGNYTIIGGPLAVNDAVQTELNTFGAVKRIYGTSRFDTSVVVAQQFFRSPEAMVLAYAQNFPDGLSGGPLAYQVEGPLVLTQNGKHAAAMTYASANNIQSGYVMGGPMLISDDTAKVIFGTASIGIK